MKRIKKGTKEEFKKIITPNEELRHIERSPFSSINIPENAEIFVQGSDIVGEIGCGASGTMMMFVVHKAHPTVPYTHINTYTHSIYKKEGDDFVDIIPYEGFYLTNHVTKNDNDLPKKIKTVLQNKEKQRLVKVLQQILSKKSIKNF